MRPAPSPPVPGQGNTAHDLCSPLEAPGQRAPEARTLTEAPHSVISPGNTTVKGRHCVRISLMPAQQDLAMMPSVSCIIRCFEKLMSQP